MAEMTTDTTTLASDPVTNEVLAGKVVEAVKAVQDAEETVVQEGKKLTAHMADPTAHGMNITTCIEQAVTDHNGDDAAHGLAAFKTDLDVSTLVRTDNAALTDTRFPKEHRHQASEVDGIPAGAVGAEQLTGAISTHNNDANAHGGSGKKLMDTHNADATAHGIGKAGSPLMTSITETVRSFADDFVAGGEGCLTIKGHVAAIKDVAAQYANAAPGVEVEPGKFGVQTFVNKADAFANALHGTEVEDGKYSARHYAEQAYLFGSVDPGVEVEPGKVGVQTYIKKADDFANAAPKVQVETGKYSARHWAEEARARADAASAVSGLPAFGLSDSGKAIVVKRDASGWTLGKSGGVETLFTPGSGALPAETNYLMPQGDEGSSVVVEQLGLFSFSESSTELVDYETCLLGRGGTETQPGRWLLLLPSADLVASELGELVADADRLARQALATSVREVKRLDARAEAAKWAMDGMVRHVSETLPAVGVGANTTVTQPVSFAGLQRGDAVVVSPEFLPKGLTCCAFVGAEHTASVVFCNSTAATITIASQVYDFVGLRASTDAG